MKRQLKKYITLSSLMITFVLLGQPLLAVSTSTEGGQIILAARDKSDVAKNDLAKALDLSSRRVDELKAKLNKLQFDEKSKEQALKDEFLKRLDEHSLYYQGTALELATTTSLDEIKDLALEVKDYRDTTYAPQTEKLVEFIMVFYTADVLNIANGRYDKINTDLNQLKNLGFIKDSEFGEPMKGARNLLDEAGALQNQAKELILSGRKQGKDSPAPRELIEKSLSDIRDTYQIFVNLSQNTKKTLGL